MKKILLPLLMLCSLLSFAQVNQPGVVITAGPFPESDTNPVPTSLTFGSVQTGTVSAAQVVTFNSSGNASVLISSVGVGTSSFSITSNTCGTILLKGTACFISVAFTPIANGAVSDTLTITSNSPESPDAISMTGTGVTGGTTAISLNKSSLAFGSITVGGSSTAQVVTATSSGTSTLTITSITLAGTNPGDFSKTTTCGGTLAAAATCTVTVTFTPTTSGARAATLVFTTNAGTSPDNVTLTGNGVTLGAGFPLSPTFGFTENSTLSGLNVPSVQFGLQRIHDSPPVNWPGINTALHAYNWTNLDNMLQVDAANGITEVEMNIGRTPPWATSQPSDFTICGYNDSGAGVGGTDSAGKGPGECFAPTDLNADGSGTNTIWKTWNTDLEAHVHNAAYLAGTGVWAAHGANCPGAVACSHAMFKYVEPMNEPDDGLNSGNSFVHMSVAQIARMIEDSACIWTGSQSGRRVIHQSQPAATPTACAATPVLNTAKIVMPPTHGKGLSVTYTQLMLYCNNVTGTFPSSANSWQLPCPVVLNAVANQVDIIAEHFKPGVEGTTAHTCGANGTLLCSVETGMALYVANINAVLSSNTPNLTSLPFWDDEAGIAPKNWTDACCTAYTDVDMQKSFYPRMWLSSLTQGIDAVVLYTYDSMVGTGTSATHGGQTAALTSYTETQTFLTGATLTVPCAITTGQVWTCTLTKSGNTYLVAWDASKSCAGGTCSTANFTATGYTKQQDFTLSTDTPHSFSNPIPLGIKPILFSN